MVQQLLKSGADVDTIDFMRNTPLHVLLLNERPRESIVRVLLDSGAPILARNDQDSTCSDLMELSNLKNIPCGQCNRECSVANEYVFRTLYLFNGTCSKRGESFRRQLSSHGDYSRMSSQFPCLPLIITPNFVHSSIRFVPS